MSHRSNLLRNLLLAAFVVIVLPGPLRAQQPTGVSKKALAQKLFRQAEKHYYLGRFSQALRLYSKAYETLPLPGFFTASR